MTPWEMLLARLRAARTWPIPQEVAVRRWIRVWQALRENDEAILRLLMSWPTDRPLILDNLGEKIAAAYGDLLFSQPPAWTPADTTDADRLDTMTGPWAPELRAAAETQVSEGEVWWRLSMVPGMTNAQLTFHSRADVVPYLHGREPLAAAFVSRLANNSGERNRVYRHVELQGAGTVVNLLFAGTTSALGDLIPLQRHMETALLPERWDHGLPLLCGRVVRRYGRRPLVGVSVYQGVWQRLLALTEATTVGRENMRLTAKKRAIIPASSARAALPTNANDPRVAAALKAGGGMGVPLMDPSRPMPRAQFDAGEDVIVMDPLDVDEGGSSTPPFRILEYSFDAEQLTTWLKFEISTIAQRCDLVPQFIGDGDFGNAPSGTALRVRLLPTTNAAEGVGSPWDAQLPVIAQRGALLEQLGQPYGGASEPWAAAGQPPAVERSDSLPADETEIATRQATLKTADLISIETALRERYPDRDDTWIGEEVDRIRADQASTLPAATTFGP
jgi:hypothetical protein